MRESEKFIQDNFPTAKDYLNEQGMKKISDLLEEFAIQKTKSYQNNKIKNQLLIGRLSEIVGTEKAFKIAEEIGNMKL